ncbi:MAG: hypothetical protein WD738_07120 [Pirellulales bacterium]
MDQLRTIFAWLKQQHFWVLTALVAVIALGSWWSAAGSLSAQYEANKNKIETEFTSLASLRGNPFHPNDIINENQDAETKKQAESVAAIWQKLYDRQREHVLEWPAALSQAFRDHVEKLQFGADIPPHLRQNYQDYVERHFPKLPEKIGARVLREGESSPYGGGGMMSRGPYRGEGGAMPMTPDQLEEDENDYICEWQDQGHVRDELNFPQRPSALRIWWTQENLWVYHTLLDVIRNTNEAAGATRMSNAAVRTIYSLEVGRPAAQGSRTPNRIYKVPVAAAPAGEGDPFGGGMPGEPGMEGGEVGLEMGRDMSFGPDGSGSGPMSPEQEAASLMSRRYLGDDGKPIPAGGAAAGGDVADPSAAAPPVDLSAFGKEYKRLPVRMVLQMDQHWLPQLISQCASQALQVEVQELRINPADGGGMESGGFGGSMPGGYRDGGGMGGSMFPDRSGLLIFPPQPNIVHVVVQGIIYIFTKPDPSVLETTGEPATPVAAL